MQRRLKKKGGMGDYALFKFNEIGQKTVIDMDIEQYKELAEMHKIARDMFKESAEMLREDNAQLREEVKQLRKQVNDMGSQIALLKGWSPQSMPRV